jgi:hypothetical protein
LTEIGRVALKTTLSEAFRRAADALARSEGEDQASPRTPETPPPETPAGQTALSPALLDRYVAGLPSAQTAVDALPGWNMALPPSVGVKAGEVPFYEDPRIHWALAQFGPLAGRSVLELGPLEASHTFMLERARPAKLDAIEANSLSFLRCLVVKELLGLKIARFHLGDFMAWLEQRPDRYDLIVASGVLYHMVEPVRLLEAIAARADAMYLWTHYASDAAMPKGDPRRMFISEPDVIECRGVRVRRYRRSYLGAWKEQSFCGGMHDLHHWLERDDILALLAALGFADLSIAHDDPGHRNGPAFSIFARRRPAP